jgi:tripartite ATP-independent transporter DctM subunit
LAAALAGFAAMLALVFLRVPIAFAMGAVGFVGFALVVSFDAAAAMVATLTYETGLSVGLSVLPLFVLMGAFVSHAGLSQELYAASNAFIGHRRGGLAMATILACGGFSAVCGSSLATAATMAKVAFRPMRAFGYSERLAGGSIAAGGTLGILIPPSVIMVIYGLLTDQSIGKLFIAGILPGIVAIAFYLAAIAVIVRIDPAAGPRGPRAGWPARFAALRHVWGILILFMVVMGGIYGGVFTPTEAGSIGAVGALVFALLRRGFDLRWLYRSALETARTTAMLFAVLIGALIFANFINLTTLPQALLTWAELFREAPIVVILLIIGVYLVLGCLLESISMITLTVPIFFPLVAQLGYDLIWFGIIVVVVTEISFLTPPIGLNVFVLRNILTEVSTETLFRGVTPFFIADIFRLGVLVAFPAITLVLPQLMR